MALGLDLCSVSAQGLQQAKSNSPWRPTLQKSCCARSAQAARAWTCSPCLTATAAGRRQPSQGFLNSTLCALRAGSASLDLFGVFDGHGGKQAAAFAAKHLLAAAVDELAAGVAKQGHGGEQENGVTIPARHHHGNGSHSTEGVCWVHAVWWPCAPMHAWLQHGVVLLSQLDLLMGSAAGQCGADTTSCVSGVAAKWRGDMHCQLEALRPPSLWRGIWGTEQPGAW